MKSALRESAPMAWLLSYRARHNICTHEKTSQHGASYKGAISGHHRRRALRRGLAGCMGAAGTPSSSPPSDHSQRSRLSIMSLPEIGHAGGGADALYGAHGVQRPQVWSHVPGGIRHLPCSQQLEAVACTPRKEVLLVLAG